MVHVSCNGANILSRGGESNKIRSWDTFCMYSMLSEVAHDFIVSSRELNKSSRIVCLAFDQVIELPVKHPELFEALGIDQPKVRFD